jgi:hypothetical protein
MTERCCRNRLTAVLTVCLLVSALLAPREGRTDNLGTWVSRDVVPWLTGQLTGYPRFKGEPVRVAAFDGSEEDPTPDLLSSTIVDTLERELSHHPDIGLVQGTPGPDWDSQRLPTPLPCVPPDEVYVIAVEARPVAGPEAAVRVRILDAEESAWVPGAVREWHGQLDVGERRELQQISARDDLRGRRELPFHPGQEDLLSARAAYVLGCALLAHPAGNLALWPGDTPDDEEAGRIARLVPRYLARTGVLRLAKSRSEANMLLAVDSQTLDADIRQVWIDLSPVDGNPELPSLRTSLYTDTPPGKAASADSVVTGMVRLEEEKPRPGLAQTACEDGGCETGTLLFARSPGSSHVELLAVTRTGFLVRLYPGSCESTAIRDDGLTLRWSPDPVTREALLTVFAVSARTPGAADALSRQFGVIPGDCDGEMLHGIAARDRLATIERTLAPYGDEIRWRRVHVAPVPRDYRMAEAGRD